MNLPRTHCRIVSDRLSRSNGGVAYSLGLEMSAAKAVCVFVEVLETPLVKALEMAVWRVEPTHHLESVELIRHGLDLLLLVWLFDFDAFCIPTLG